MSQEQQLDAEVSGTVCRIECEVGAVLNQGDAIAVIESMKMEIPVAVDRPVRLVRLLVAVGDLVNEGQPIAVVANI